MNGFAVKQLTPVLPVNKLIAQLFITFLWWFCRGCSPLPIPNREVKPLMANGTAPKCGRVGSCHIYLIKPFRNERLFYCTDSMGFLF